MKILIVEDEPAIAKGLKFNFEAEGYDTTVVDNGPDALELLRLVAPPFDLIVLDLMLPGMSGYEVCEKIRSEDESPPLLVLSARTLAEDKARAFELGADQYMTKPFALTELLARVKNLLARPKNGNRKSEDPIEDAHRASFGSVLVDFDKFEVSSDGTTHQLTTREMQLLQYFLENEDVVLSRTRILRDVWGERDGIVTRSIDNFVLRLRRVVEENPAEPRHILSVRGTGYRFVSSPDGESEALEDDEA